MVKSSIYDTFVYTDWQDYSGQELEYYCRTRYTLCIMLNYAVGVGAAVLLLSSEPAGGCLITFPDPDLSPAPYISNFFIFSR